MMATNLAAARQVYGRNRARTLPVAITLLYVFEPVAAALCLICLAPFLAILALAIRAATA